MKKLVWKEWIGVGAVALGIALVAFLGLQLGQHLLQDHREHHLILEVLGYNIQQGKLLPLPVSAPPPKPAPAPPPAPPLAPPSKPEK